MLTYSAVTLCRSLSRDSVIKLDYPWQDTLIFEIHCGHHEGSTWIIQARKT